MPELSDLDGPNSARTEAKAAKVRRLVLKNTAFFTLAQIAGMPLSLLVSAVTARYLGATALGYLYLATTFNSFAFIAVDWGQGGALPALVAEDRSQSGRLLGTALVWRALTSVIVTAMLAGGCYLLGYNTDVLMAVFLVSVGYGLSALANGYQSVTLGFERTDIAARRQIFEQATALFLVVPILLLGGKLTIVLTAHAGVGAVVLFYVWRTTRGEGVGKLSVESEALKALLRRGTPFVFLGVAMVLQPYVDALFLSKLGSSDAVGWHAAARKLVGLLIFPAASMTGALYPTLCRLNATDQGGLKTAVSDVLRATSLLVVPVALGCALFPGIGVAVYSHRSFGPAEENLRVLALFLVLVYFTMPLGTCIVAIGKSRAWAVVQSLCVGVSVVLDPLLVPWFQRRYGNGGLGVCWAAVVSEIVVLVLGVWFVPRGVFGRRFWRTLILSSISGLGMVAVAYVLHSWNAFVVAPIAVLAYAVLLRVTGAIDKDQTAAARNFVMRKLRRAPTPS